MKFTKKKKIAFLIPGFGFLGAQKLCYTLINALDKDKYDPYLIVQDSTGGQFPEQNSLPKYYTLKSKSNGGIVSKLQTLFAPLELAKIIRKTKPDMVISIAPWTNFVLLFSKYFFRGLRPILMIEEHQHLSTSHKLDNDSVSFLMKTMYRYLIWMYNKADIVRFVSEESKQDFVENWKVSSQKTIVLNGFVDINKLTVLSEQKMDNNIANFIEGSDHVVVASGRLEVQKDFLLLISSFRLVLDKNENAKLVIMGEGSLRPKLQKVIDDGMLNQHILLAGFIANPYAVLKKANIFCLTSIWEGMPVVIIEAMALGCPVVSVDCPSGPKEMIKNGVNGKLVSRDRKEIADAIDYFLNNAEERQRSANEAFQSAKEWDISKYMHKFTALLDHQLVE